MNLCSSDNHYTTAPQTLYIVVPLSFWVSVCTQEMAHPHNSQPALKIFSVLAQGKAQEVHGNYFNGLFKKNSCSVQLGHFGTQLGLKTGGSS